jgi:predicted SAM-dependent methyltransferase
MQSKKKSRKINKKMKYLKRDRSIITNKKDLEILKVFKDFPVFIGATNQPYKKDLRADLSIAIDKDTGIIQLNKLLPLDIVYSQYHSEALGGVWKEHHDLFIAFLSKYKLNKILEIGGSNGYMAKEYLKKNKKADWIMVEPTPSIKSFKRLLIIPKMFDKKFKLDYEVDGVVHSHVFEHIYDSAEFLEAISNFLKSGQYHIFTVPNLYKYLKNKYANWINFEHTIFLTEYYIDYLLKLYGFEIIEKKYFKEHSIFYSTRKLEKNKKIAPIKNIYKENKKLFESFMLFYKKDVKRINKKVEKFDGEIYLYGAHIISQFTIAMGLNGKIIKVLDNSNIKKGKRLYGTKYIIDKPSIIKNKAKVAVILRMGAHGEEVRKQILSINPNTLII